MPLGIDILEEVLNAKKAYELKDKRSAWERWCRIYDIAEKAKNIKMLNTAMSLFTDEEVYQITDWGKELSGYWK